MRTSQVSAVGTAGTARAVNAMENLYAGLSKPSVPAVPKLLAGPTSPAECPMLREPKKPEYDYRTLPVERPMTGLTWRQPPDPRRCAGCGSAESSCQVGRMLGDDRCCVRCVETRGESHEAAS